MTAPAPKVIIPDEKTERQLTGESRKEPGLARTARMVRIADIKINAQYPVATFYGQHPVKAAGLVS